MRAKGFLIEVLTALGECLCVALSEHVPSPWSISNPGATTSTRFTRTAAWTTWGRLNSSSSVAPFPP